MNRKGWSRGREVIGERLRDKTVPFQVKHRPIPTVTNSFLCGAHLHRMGLRVSVEDEHISKNHFYILHTVADRVALNDTQDSVKIADSLPTLMKDCNSYLTKSLCQDLAVSDMVVYHYLTNLDFVKDPSGYKTNFGRIPQAEVRFPHTHLFPKLAVELFKVGCLLGSCSDHRYTIFMSPDIHLVLVHYTEQVDPWFDTVVTYNFITSAEILD